MRRGRAEGPLDMRHAGFGYAEIELCGNHRETLLPYRVREYCG